MLSGSEAAEKGTGFYLFSVMLSFLQKLKKKKTESKVQIFSIKSRISTLINKIWFIVFCTTTHIIFLEPAEF